MSDWGGCVASARIEGYWMNGPWVITNPEELYNKADREDWHAGDGECPAIAQQTMGMPHTSFWRPGLKVLGNGTPTFYEGREVFGSGIVPGTAIATFIDKKYPSHIHGNHVAIYLSQGRNYIDVIDQWVRRDKHGKVLEYIKPHKRTIYTSTGISNNADAFSVIYTFGG